MSVNAEGPVKRDSSNKRASKINYYKPHNLTGVNKSVERYLEGKFKEVHKTEINNIQDTNVNTNNTSINNISLNIKEYKNRRMKSPNNRRKLNLSVDLKMDKKSLNKSFSENKTLKKYTHEKLEYLKESRTIEGSSKFSHEVEEETDNSNLFKTDPISNDHVHKMNLNITESSPSDDPEMNRKLENIKCSLIELVNETRDKNKLIKEFDLIYLNVFKVSNPMHRFNFFNEDEINYMNMSQLSHCVSSSQSKPSIFLNTKDPAIGEMINHENEVLKSENNNLKIKIEEIDKKFDSIFKENDELKSFFNEKAKDFTIMETVLKKFENELNDVKKQQSNSNKCESNIVTNVPKKITSKTQMKKYNQINSYINKSVNVKPKTTNKKYEKTNKTVKSLIKSSVVNETVSFPSPTPHALNYTQLLNGFESDNAIEEEGSSIMQSSMMSEDPRFNYIPQKTVCNHISNPPIPKLTLEEITNDNLIDQSEYSTYTNQNVDNEFLNDAFVEAQENEEIDSHDESYINLKKSLEKKVI